MTKHRTSDWYRFEHLHMSSVTKPTTFWSGTWITAFLVKQCNTDESYRTHPATLSLAPHIWRGYSLPPHSQDWGRGKSYFMEKAPVKFFTCFARGKGARNDGVRSESLYSGNGVFEWALSWPCLRHGHHAYHSVSPHHMLHPQWTLEVLKVALHLWLSVVPYFMFGVSASMAPVRYVASIQQSAPGYLKWVSIVF